MATTSAPPLETFTFHWSREHGDCYECGRPAAFLVPDAYGPGQPLGAQHKRCAVCAANDAADGERVTRIDTHQENPGDPIPYTTQEPQP